MKVDMTSETEENIIWLMMDLVKEIVPPIPDDLKRKYMEGWERAIKNRLRVNFETQMTLAWWMNNDSPAPRRKKQ